jgi:hypothetical protein
LILFFGVLAAFASGMVNSLSGGGAADGLLSLKTRLTLAGRTENLARARQVFRL